MDSEAHLVSRAMGKRRLDGVDDSAESSSVAQLAAQPTSQADEECRARRLAKKASKREDAAAAKPVAKRAAKPAAKPAVTQQQLKLALAAASTRPDPEVAVFKRNVKEWHMAQEAWVNSWEGEACAI